MADYRQLGRVLERVILFVALVFASAEFWKDHRGGSSARYPAPTIRRVTGWQELSAGGVRLGDAQAAVTIVDFLDYQCPFCRDVEAALDSVRMRYGSRVAIVYRHFPMHKYARAAAIAAYCAAQYGRFEAFHRVLFASQDSIGSKPWEELAAIAGIGESAAFRRCMEDPYVAEQVHIDSLAAVALEATGTPTLVINDVLIPGDPGLEMLRQYVDEALESAVR